MRGPLVSCVVLSSRGQGYLEDALHVFNDQGYESTEMVLVSAKLYLRGDAYGDNVRPFEVPAGLSLGEMRNFAARKAGGSIIVTQDDDDHYAPTRLERIVEALRSHDVCGSSLVRLENAQAKERWLWDGSKLPPGFPRLYGATLAFRRALWERHPFDPYQHVGEDTKWLETLPVGTRVHDFRDPDMSMHAIGHDNTGFKVPDPSTWTREPW